MYDFILNMGFEGQDKRKKKLRGMSPRENYTDRATASCRRSLTDPYGRIPCFEDRNRYFFYQVAPHMYSRG
jgi:hypothetical protein